MLLQPEVVADVDREVAGLERHMQRLNFGAPTRRASAEDPFAAFKDAKRQRLAADSIPGSRATDAELQISLEVLFTFLEKRASPLRTVMNSLSSGERRAEWAGNQAGPDN